MEIAARIMITGGHEREDARMTRADRLLIRNAIFQAAKRVREEKRDQVLTQDVVDALHHISRDKELPEHRRNRTLEMGDGMALFAPAWPENSSTVLALPGLKRMSPSSPVKAMRTNSPWSTSP